MLRTKRTGAGNQGHPFQFIIKVGGFTSHNHWIGVQKIHIVNEGYKHCNTVGFGKQINRFKDLSNVNKTTLSNHAVLFESGTNFVTKIISFVPNHRVWYRKKQERILLNKWIFLWLIETILHFCFIIFNQPYYLHN